MPLLDLSSDDAVGNRKSNPLATWGNRNQPNRVEPFAKPGFDAPFAIAPGETIFTVGSCFARNIEVELLRRGFSLPMRDLFRTEAFRGFDPGVVNNFGTPSIYNEFAWALGERTFDPETQILEVQPGRFADLNVISSIRPEARALVEARRRAITAAYGAVTGCRVVIMTLGLVEVWFDTSTGLYLNAAPFPSLLRGSPERFRLHVLSFEEAWHFLEQTLLLLRAKGRPDLQVLLTVSPVPLAVTHRRQDVMVANSYSKSVLRALAETATARHDFVTYFPSYESVLLSDRQVAWASDFTHVTDEIVALNVGRMIDAFVGPPADAGNDPVPDGDTHSDASLALMVERAASAQNGSATQAAAFFEKHGALSRRSADFAAQQARFLVREHRYEDALATLASAPAVGAEADKTGLLRAEVLLKLGRARDAYGLLDLMVARGKQPNAAWVQLMRAAQAVGETTLVLGVLGRWTRAAPRRAARANGMVGRWLFERGEVGDALGYLRLATQGGDVLGQIHFAEALVALGKGDEALAVFEAIHPETPGDVIRHGRLRRTLGLA